MADADFKLWNKKDEDGGLDSYTGTQGQSGILNTNSLESSDSTWVIIFSENGYDKNCDGDYKLINPNTTLDHLKDVTRGSGDWENNIKSFWLYKTKPSWWNSGTRPTYDQLFEQPNNQALFTKGTNYTDSNGVFPAPSSEVDLLNTNYTSTGNRMDDEYDPGNISSISTGPNSWLLVFDGSSCTGNFLKIDPNTQQPDLGTLDRYDMDGVRQGDWANDISSFLLYPSKPIFWDTDYPGPYLDKQNFCDAFPNGSLSGSTVKYVIANDTFSVDYPDTIQSATQVLPNYYDNIDTDNLPADGWTRFDVNLEHKNVMGMNDTASFTLFFDNSSELVSIQNFVWHSNDGSYEIDDTTIATVDLDLEVLGDETAIETCGITIVVANVLAGVFDTASSIFNHLSAAIFNKNDDGGRYYFLPVICHTINRISTTVFNNYGIATYTSSSDPRANNTLDFDYSDFKSAIQAADNNFSSVGNWTTYTGSNSNSDAEDPNNKVMEMTYSGSNYRTWHLETSMTQDLGMLVSCKIDYEPTSGDEDHVILMAGFTMPTSGSTTPILAFAQATIQFTDDSSMNIMSDSYSTGDIIDSLYNDLQGQLNAYSFSGDNQGRKFLADITKANLEAMVNCTEMTAKTANKVSRSIAAEV